MRPSNRLFTLFTVLVAVFLMIPSISLADDFQRRINVNGTGEVQVAPDIAILRLGAISRSENLERATMEINEIMQNVMNVAESFSIEPSRLKTDQMNISTMFQHRRDGDPTQVDYYEVRQMIEVTFVDLDMDRVQSFLYRAVEQGANQVLGLNYALSDLQQYRNEARQLAMQNAINRANSLIEETEMHLGNPISIEEYESYQRHNYWGGTSDAYTSQVVMTHDSGNGPDPGTSSAGMITVKSQIRVSFELVE